MYPDGALTYTVVGHIHILALLTETTLLVDLRIFLRYKDSYV